MILLYNYNAAIIEYNRLLVASNILFIYIVKQTFPAPLVKEKCLEGIELFNNTYILHALNKAQIV